MRLCNSRIPEEYLVCYQMSQRNWVIIKMRYKYLRRCLLGCMDRDWDLSLQVTERYLWALSVIQHHKKLHVTNQFSHRILYYERAQRYLSVIQSDKSQS